MASTVWGPWKTPKDFTCPAGHRGNFTVYGLGIYSCHTCSNIGEYKFVMRRGQPYWPEPELVPIGLRKMAEAHALTT